MISVDSNNNRHETEHVFNNTTTDTLWQNGITQASKKMTGNFVKFQDIVDDVPESIFAAFRAARMATKALSN